MGHLITYCSCDLCTTDNEGGPLTNVYIGSDYYMGCLLQSLKLHNISSQIKSKYDTEKCQNYITIQHAVSDHADTDFFDHINKCCLMQNIHFLHCYSRDQQSINCKLVWPRNIEVTDHLNRSSKGWNILIGLIWSQTEMREFFHIPQTCHFCFDYGSRWWCLLGLV